MSGEQLEQLLLVAPQLVRRMLGEAGELEPQDVHTLEEHQVERYAGDGPGRVADRHEPPAPAQ